MYYIPSAEECECYGSDKLNRSIKPPFRHLVFVRILIDFFPYLARLEEPTNADTLSNADYNKVNLVRPVVYDIQPAQSCARDKDYRNCSHYKHYALRNFFLVYTKLVAECLGHTLCNGERRVDCKRCECKIEYYTEHSVNPTDISKLYDSFRIDKECSSNARSGHIVNGHSSAVHGGEEYDARKYAYKHITDCDNERVFRNIRIFFQIRAVSEHNRHHYRQREEHLSECVNPKRRITKRRPIGNEERVHSFTEVGICDKALERKYEKERNGNKYGILNYLTYAMRAVSYAEINKSPSNNCSKKHPNRNISTCSGKLNAPSRLSNLTEEVAGGVKTFLSATVHTAEAEGCKYHCNNPRKNDSVITANYETVEYGRPAHFFSLRVNTLERFRRASSHSSRDSDFHSEKGNTEHNQRQDVNEQECSASMFCNEAGEAPTVAETNGRTDCR